MCIRDRTWLASLSESSLSVNVAPAFYKVPIFVNDGAPFDRASFLSVVQPEGIALAEGFRGFAKRSSRRCRGVGDLDHSRRAAARTMALHHPVLLSDEVDIERLVETLGRAEKYLMG